jgi:hypothetical protein
VVFARIFSLDFLKHSRHEVRLANPLNLSI